MSGPREDSATTVIKPVASAVEETVKIAPFGSSPTQKAVVADLQHSLRKHGIEAGAIEIGTGLMEALASRPALCRGLLAAYLLDL